MTRLGLVFSLLIFHVLAIAQCDHSLVLYDNANNGWSGSSLNLKINGDLVLSNVTLASGSSDTYVFSAEEGDTIETEYSSGTNPHENRYVIRNPNGTFIISDGNGDETPSVSIKAIANCSEVSLFTSNGDSYQSAEQSFILTEDLPGKSGSVWYNYKVDLSEDFQIDFKVFLGDKEVTLENSGADGITFALQGNCSASGGTGQSLGYGGITPSIAVEFDSYQNSGENDPSDDHIAIVSNGSVDHGAVANLAGPEIIVAGFEDSVWYDVKIVWINSTQVFEVFFDGNSITSYTGDIINDIFAGNPIVFWGFTGGTGALYNRQEVYIPVLPVNSTALTDISCEVCTEQIFIAQGANSYTWTPDDGSISDPSIYNPVFTPSVTTEYTVVIEDACGNFITDKFTIFNTLPIELLFFEGEKIGPYVKLKWQTSSETNNAYYVIQKSLDAINFDDLVTIEGAGNSNVCIDYNWVDYQPSDQISFYRLKQVDYDGEYSFSKIVSIDFGIEIDEKILFVSDLNMIYLEGFETDFIFYCICNAIGQEIFRGFLKSGESKINLNFLNKGVYIFSIQERDQENKSIKIVVN